LILIEIKVLEVPWFIVPPPPLPVLLAKVRLCELLKLFVITLVNTQKVSVAEIVDSSSIQCAESKYGLRIQFLALVVMMNGVWLNA
jgi:hypothetical protein